MDPPRPLSILKLHLYFFTFFFYISPTLVKTVENRSGPLFYSSGRKWNRSPNKRIEPHFRLLGAQYFGEVKWNNIPWIEPPGSIFPEQRNSVLMKLFTSLLFLNLIPWGSSTCLQQFRLKQDDDFITTFIVPSTGRIVLYRALESILNQTSPKWLAIVYFDGVTTDGNYLLNQTPLFLPNLPYDDRLCYAYSQHLGSINCAANVRNLAIQSVITPWVSFLDDDDTVDPKLVEHIILTQNKSKKLDCIIFRMFMNNVYYPKLQHDDIYLNDVGISFTAKSDLFQKESIWFEPSVAEDFSTCCL